MNITKRSFTICLASLMLLVSQLALADTPDSDKQPSVDEILNAMDKNISGFDDQFMDIELTITDNIDKSEKRYEMKVYQKGEEKRLIRILSGEMKGMSTLIESRNRMYVFLPGFKKVRRIASHNMNQSFAGSDFTNDDMASTTWASSHNSTIIDEDEKHWYIECFPKEDKNYKKVIISVDKESKQQAKVEYFNGKDEKFKEMIASDMRDFQGTKRFSNIIMRDPRTGHKTKMIIREFEVNQNLRSSLFTVRQLQWGR